MPTQSVAAVLLAQCASEAALMSFYGDSTSGRLLYGDAVDAAAFAGLPLAVRFTDPLLPLPDCLAAPTSPGD